MQNRDPDHSLPGRCQFVNFHTKQVEGVITTVEEMNKISCWIDLLPPHYADYLKGMGPEDKPKYNSRLTKRTNWAKAGSTQYRPVYK